ncbi:hypothetical protein [Natronospora cellulosivora (SeqCode)]
MNFVRKGPAYLFFCAQKVSPVEKFLVEFLDGKLTELSNALENGEEDDTIIFLANCESDKIRVKDTSSIIFLKASPFFVLEKIINHGFSSYLKKVESGAGQVVMRIPKDGDKIIKEIKKRYNAKKVDLEEGIDMGASTDTIISFTEEPLRNKLNSLKFIKDILLVSRPIHIFLQELRRDSVRYITGGLDNYEWYELKINIYDSEDMYEKQYERLILSFSDLEAGFILGETWTQDHALALMSVPAYQIRLFTFLSPKEIKEILMGLEYNEQGKRLVDFDLYYNSKKYSWYKLNEKRNKINRIEMGLKQRKSLVSSLSQNTYQELIKIEKELLK